ncbi:hypothetical protein [Pinirhizobacter soli]|uniref:hypothetical protein n=1 Tax=Pinirhizobacter soli TaxID=2786953 RepID=UPI00202A5F0F|nr:hypothetical protein [Pinirhizobacter soli]
MHMSRLRALASRMLTASARCLLAFLALGCFTMIASPLHAAPVLGAHTLLAHGEGLGVSPTVTDPIDTQPGSTLLLMNGGYASNADTPSDNYGNRFKSLQRAVAFGNGYDRFNVSSYIVIGAKGGQGHRLTFAKRGEPKGEISVPFIEIRGGVVKDIAQTYAEPGLQVTSGKVTTTGPALLLAFWWGDGGVKRMTAEPGDGFAIVDSFLKLPDESGVQCAVASRSVDAAGTYSVTWTGAPVQGAILWLIAFQAPPGTPDVPPSVARAH